MGKVRIGMTDSRTIANPDRRYLWSIFHTALNGKRAIVLVIKLLGFGESMGMLA